MSEKLALPELVLQSYQTVSLHARNPLFHYQTSHTHNVQVLSYNYNYVDTMIQYVTLRVCSGTIHALDDTICNTVSVASTEYVYLTLYVLNQKPGIGSSITNINVGQCKSTDLQ